MGDDASEESRRAGELAARLAGPYGASALLLRAYHPQQVLGTVRAASHDPEAADVALEAGEEQLRKRALELKDILGREPRVKVVAGDAATAIQREAEDGGDAKLVAVGSRGLGAVRRFALGSVSADVLRAVDGPVLIAPPIPDEDPPGADRHAGHSEEGRERGPRDRETTTDALLAPRFC